MLALSNLTKVFFLLFTFSQLALFASARPPVNLIRGFSLKRKGVDSSLVTNAARMQAGLGPLKPRTLFNPSRVAARAPDPSAVVMITGTIKVTRASDGVVVGFISKSQGQQGYTVTTTNSQKMTVSFNPASSPFNIAILSSGAMYPNLGFDGTSLKTNSGAALMVSTGPTPPGAIPQMVGNSLGYSAYSESSVWFYDAATQGLTAQWINPDGTSPTIYIRYYAGANDVVLEGSMANTATVNVILTLV